jgi:hypothetical protein
MDYFVFAGYVTALQDRGALPMAYSSNRRQLHGVGVEL